MGKRLSGILVGIALLSGVIWGSDRVTVEGQRTIYTVDCAQGEWQGLICTGKLSAGDRYRYLSLKARNEVIFWIAGTNEPSGKFTECSVQDRGNWSCKPNSDVGRSITHEMVNDRALSDAKGATRPFHAVPKWKWWFLKIGFPGLHKASY
jgi:hypothetical protein